MTELGKKNITTEKRQDVPFVPVKDRGVKFKPGNKVATANKGKKKLTKQKIQRALIRASDLLGQKLNKYDVISKEDLIAEANRILLQDGLRASAVEIRLKYAEMLFKFFNAPVMNEQPGLGGAGLNNFNVIVIKTDKEGRAVIQDLQKVQDVSDAEVITTNGAPKI